MFKRLKNRDGQTTMGEYALVLFLVIGMMTAMTIFVKRAIQARIRDARFGMTDVIQNRITGFNVSANVYRVYEPYYREEDTAVSFTASQDDVFGLGGTFDKTFEETRTTDGTRIQAPPIDAD